MITQEVLIHFVHRARFFDGLFSRFVRGVAFLPEELSGAEEKTWAHLPAHDVAPLVDEQRQIAVAFHPAGEGSTDDRLRSWTNHKRLGQFAGGDHLDRAIRLLLRFETMMRDHRTLGGETFGMLRLFFEITQRNQQREIGVHMAGGLELRIELALDVFPQAVTPRLDHHAAAHLGVLRHVGGTHDLLVPFGKIFVACRSDGGGVAHGVSRIEANSGRSNGAVICFDETKFFIALQDSPRID